MDFAHYFNRIGLSWPRAVTPDTLAALQFAQRASIPFENIDVLLGRGISTEPAAIFTKLVTQRRGGYCFEQNQLLAGALTALGVPHQLVLARVWLGANEMPAHTHLAVVAELAGQRWLLDAGFGGGYCPPLPLVAGLPPGALPRSLPDDAPAQEFECETLEAWQPWKRPPGLRGLDAGRLA